MLERKKKELNIVHVKACFVVASRTKNQQF